MELDTTVTDSPKTSLEITDQKIQDQSHVAEPMRELPYNLQAEKGLLGSILINNRAHETVTEFLNPEHFSYLRHGKIYEAISKLIDRGQIADGVTLQRFFEHDQSLAEIGGPAYLAELTSAAATVINAGEYGRVIYDLHLKRELINLGELIVNRAYGAEVDETGVIQIESAEQSLYELATKGDHEGGFQDFKTSLILATESAGVAHKRQGGLAGVATRFTELDKLLGGLHNSDLIIIAGRPAMGKTALATNIAFNAAALFQATNGDEGAIVGFFSLEMSSDQLAARILAEQSGIPSNKARKGELTNDEFSQLAQASQALYDVPIYIDDTPALTVSALRTRARRLKRQQGLGLIVVDYLQLISGSNQNRNDGRVQEVSEITRGLKTLAKELNIPVIALSQLSRAVETREDKHPQLADLRESGSIEQDADVVMFIYRDEYYIEKSEPKMRADESVDKHSERIRNWEERLEKAKGLADLIIAKQRHGPVGSIRLHFSPEFTRFGNFDNIHK